MESTNILTSWKREMTSDPWIPLLSVSYRERVQPEEDQDEDDDDDDDDDE